MDIPPTGQPPEEKDYNYVHASKAAITIKIRFGLETRSILVANATRFSHLLPGFSCGSKHLLLP